MVLFCLILCNIQGQWKHKFNRQNSIESKFHVSKTHSCLVQMMYQENTYHYGNFPEDKVQVLEMFYNGEGISMVIILPNKDEKLAEVKKKKILQFSYFWKKKDQTSIF